SAVGAIEAPRGGTRRGAGSLRGGVVGLSCRAYLAQPAPLSGGGWALFLRAGGGTPSGGAGATSAGSMQANSFRVGGRSALVAATGSERRRSAEATSKSPMSSAAALRNQPERCTPWVRANHPNRSENGKNSTQASVPTPEETPALMFEGRPSCRSLPA